MANPNILTASSVVGVTTFFSTQELQTRSTSTSSVYYQYNVPIYNPAGSGKIIKVKEILAYCYSSLNEAFFVNLIIDLTSTSSANFKRLATTEVVGNFENIRILNKSPTNVGLGNSTIDMEYFYVMENQGIEVATTSTSTLGSYFVVFVYEEITA